MERPPDTTDDASAQMTRAGIRTLLGNPQSAILKLSLPMIIAMSLQTLYNLVDTFWVSGLGPDALAALGFVFPFFFIAVGLSNGLGVGGGSAISRMIGAHNKRGADNIAVHTIVLMVMLSGVFTIPLFFFAEDIFLLIGAGRTAGLASAYGRIIFLGAILIFFTNIANAILRAEGDARRAMYAMVLSAGLNIVLDPIFIYTFGMGVEGAAWATVISLAVSSIIMLNWLLVKKDTYVSFAFRGFRFDRDALRDILRVGLPASVQMLCMAGTMMIMNYLIIVVANTDGVAVYSVGWRVVSVAITPLLAIATAVVTVSGAAYGAHAFRKAEIGHLYATKIGFFIGCAIAAATFVLAPQITAAFTMTEATAHLAGDLTTFLRIVCIFYPTTAFGIFSSSLFQGAGKGMYSLLVTILRSIILTPLFAAIFAVTLGWGLVGVWWGLVAGNSIGSAVAYIWARYYTCSLASERFSLWR